MRMFEEPNIEVVKFAVEDIVTTSELLPPPPAIGGNVGNCIG